MFKQEVEEVREAKEVQERNTEVAAFFDLDGTLTVLPTLEKRLVRRLRYQHAIGIANYLRWMREALRLAPRGINHVLYANKMYLRGMRLDNADRADYEKTLRQHAKPQLSNARELSWVVSSTFFPEALERMAWHGERGHAIVIVSGTLEPLAKEAAASLEEQLADHGCATSIEVCATRLETADGAWTGRIVGEAMFGEAKARAMKRIAAKRGFDLEACFAYGDSVHDRWMLESVGKPTAVNPSDDLRRIAKRNEWPVLQWNEEKALPQGARSAKSQSRREVRVRKRPAANSRRCV